MANVPSIAAMVYDQEHHSEADLAFLAAVARADNDWHEALQSANKQYGGGSLAWEAVKHLATRQRNADYQQALKLLDVFDAEPIQQAAE